MNVGICLFCGVRTFFDSKGMIQYHVATPIEIARFSPTTATRKARIMAAVA
jgi:hypothetical protein